MRKFDIRLFCSPLQKVFAVINGRRYLSFRPWHRYSTPRALGPSNPRCCIMIAQVANLATMFVYIRKTSLISKIRKVGPEKIFYWAGDASIYILRAEVFAFRLSFTSDEMPEIPNPRLLYKSIPKGYPIPGVHLIYDTSRSIDLENTPLNGGFLTKTLVVSPQPWLRERLRWVVGHLFRASKYLLKNNFHRDPERVSYSTPMRLGYTYSRLPRCGRACHAN